MLKQAKSKVRSVADGQGTANRLREGYSNGETRSNWGLRSTLTD